jgi:hypothetical protein
MKTEVYEYSYTHGNLFVTSTASKVELGFVSGRTYIITVGGRTSTAAGSFSVKAEGKQGFADKLKRRNWTPTVMAPDPDGYVQTVYKITHPTPLEAVEYYDLLAHNELIETIFGQYHGVTQNAVKAAWIQDLCAIRLFSDVVQHHLILRCFFDVLSAGY